MTLVPYWFAGRPPPRVSLVLAAAHYVRKRFAKDTQRGPPATVADAPLSITGGARRSVRLSDFCAQRSGARRTFRQQPRQATATEPTAAGPSRRDSSRAALREGASTSLPCGARRRDDRGYCRAPPANSRSSARSRSGVPMSCQRPGWLTPPTRPSRIASINKGASLDG